MRRAMPLVVGAALLMGVGPAAAQYRSAAENGLRIRLGLFQPEGDSRYWEEKAIDFTGDADDLEDASLGVEYQRQLMPVLHLLAGGTFFESGLDQAYRDFEDSRGGDIEHTTTLSRVALDVGLRVDLLPPGAPLVPYLGGGGSLIAWRLEEDGDFIDFGVDPPELFSDLFEAEGTAAGYFLLAGLEIPIGASFSLFAEGRWHEAEDDLGDDFEEFGELDLSAREYAAGLAFRF